MPPPAAAVQHRRASPTWSLQLGNPIRAIRLARESGTVFVRDDRDGLYLVDRRGTRQAQLQAPRALTAIDCSLDGLCLAVGVEEGELWSLAPDLMPRWQRSLGQPVESVAVEPLGRYIAACDDQGRLHLFTRSGQCLWTFDCPRPLRFLSFVPEAACLVGSAEFGLVLCVDERGAMTWRDGLVAHVGSLAVSGNGETIILACFTDGLVRYGLKQPRPERRPMEDACRLADVSYDGSTVMTAGLTEAIHLRDAQAQERGEYKLEAPATALALDPLAERAVIGTARGLLQGLQWR